MSPGVELVFRGAPRDLGLDQGRALGAALREELRAAPPAGGLARLLPSLGAEPRVAHCGRDAERYFPHMAERAAGLARGAGLPRAALAAFLAREGCEGAGWQRAAAPAALLGVTPERSGAGPLLARGLELPVGSSASYVLRRSEPEHDFHSLELALPWLVPAVAGVNQHGLAAALSAVAPGAAGSGPCAAPALLLVQDCLQRFDRVEPAIEWCERRPAGGRAALLLADATGDLAAVWVDGAERRVQRPAQGVVLGPDEPARASRLEKACLARTPCDGAALLELLNEPPQPASGRRLAGRVLLDPTARTLQLNGDVGLEV